jgi:hypothetical protein
MVNKLLEPHLLVDGLVIEVYGFFYKDLLGKLFFSNSVMI